MVRLVTTAAVNDGRAARSQRTRIAVVDALLDLLHAGALRPTAREIANRAGVSLRSVYVHFDDLEDLFLAAALRQRELVPRSARARPVKGTCTERADALAAARGRIHEAMGPVRRAAALQEPSSPTLSRLHERFRRAACADAARMFATELDPLPPRERTRRLAVIDCLLGGATWDLMRTAHGLGHHDARDAIARAVVDVLETRG